MAVAVHPSLSDCNYPRFVLRLVQLKWACFDISGRSDRMRHMKSFGVESGQNVNRDRGAGTRSLLRYAKLAAIISAAVFMAGCDKCGDPVKFRLPTGASVCDSKPSTN
jgi:hypothetical protein